MWHFSFKLNFVKEIKSWSGFILCADVHFTTGWKFCVSSAVLCLLIGQASVTVVGVVTAVSVLVCFGLFISLSFLVPDGLDGK